MKKATVDIDITLDNGAQVKMKIQFDDHGHKTVSVENPDAALGDGFYDLTRHLVRLLSDPEYAHLLYNPNRTVRLSVGRIVPHSTLSEK